MRGAVFFLLLPPFLSVAEDPASLLNILPAVSTATQTRVPLVPAGASISPLLNMELELSTSRLYSDVLYYNATQNLSSSALPNITFSVPGQGVSRNHASIIMAVAITALYSVVCVVGLLGNVLVMYGIVRYTKMKTATNIYIFNLALADALATSTLPFQSAKYLMETWPFGEILCKIVLSIDYYNMFTSIFTLTMMSVDRYIAVCHPVRALDFRTPSKAKAINVCIWILSSVIGVPIMVMAVTRTNKAGAVVCTLQFPRPDWYWDTVTKICVFIFAFVVPVMVITVCYGLMILRLRSVRLLSGSREKDRNLRRITRMVLVVVAAFIICWTPIHIFVIVWTMVEIDKKNPYVIASWHFCIALGYTNSSLNPVLYAFLDENFKRCFREFCLPFRSHSEQSSFSRARNTTRDQVSTCAQSHAPDKPV
ncbi:delta-type opioid receptor-like isoform X1 [Phyllobates terribilis]|uniref:delta-type opioid receptor-like isoform X1 n=2 Tax=Phyllobates terribilis TaxID=111132 RepID=UPI003CCB4347